MAVRRAGPIRKKNSMNRNSIVALCLFSASLPAFAKRFECAALFGRLGEATYQKLASRVGTGEKKRLSLEEALELGSTFITDPKLRERFIATASGNLEGVDVAEPLLARYGFGVENRIRQRGWAERWIRVAADEAGVPFDHSRFVAQWRREELPRHCGDVLEKLLDSVRIVFEAKALDRRTWMNLPLRRRLAWNRAFLSQAEEMLFYSYRIYRGFEAYLSAEGIKLEMRPGDTARAAEWKSLCFDRFFRPEMPETVFSGGFV